MHPEIDVDTVIATTDPMSGEWFIFVSDNSHLTKNIVTALKESSVKRSKRNIKYGKCPVNLGMVKNVWIGMSGATLQLHPTKL